MKKLLLLIWLIPAYLLFLGYYEVSTYVGLHYTYNTGESYIAQVDEFKIKNLQAQSNGHIKISFSDLEGNLHHREMSLPIQLAAQLQTYSMIPIRYLKTSSMDVVFMPTYEFQSDMVKMNCAICLISFLFTAWAAWRISKYALKLSKTEALDSAVQDAWNNVQKGTV